MLFRSSLPGFTPLLKRSRKCNIFLVNIFAHSHPSLCSNYIASLCNLSFIQLYLSIGFTENFDNDDEVIETEAFFLSALMRHSKSLVKLSLIRDWKNKIKAVSVFSYVRRAAFYPVT